MSKGIVKIQKWKQKTANKIIGWAETLDNINAYIPDFYLKTTGIIHGMPIEIKLDEINMPIVKKVTILASADVAFLAKKELITRFKIIYFRIAMEVAEIEIINTKRNLRIISFYLSDTNINQAKSDTTASKTC